MRSGPVTACLGLMLAIACGDRSGAPTRVKRAQRFAPRFEMGAAVRGPPFALRGLAWSASERLDEVAV
jgi:hypothetical protein